MKKDEKIASALQILAGTGMWSANYAPPIYRLLWRFGVRIPPPHFCSFGANFLFLATLFGSIWGLFMWFAFWSPEGKSASSSFLLAAGGGVVFGLLMAIYYRFGAARHALPAWTAVGSGGVSSE